MTGRVSRLVTLLVSVVAGATTVGWAWAHASENTFASAPADERRFPHAEHARLFPTCETCHAGVMDDDASTRFPSPESCGECHDGDRERRVTWNGPAVPPSNLAFSHAEHAREVRGDTAALACRTCHATPGDSVYMAVERARVGSCLSCHAHRATAHLADDAPCARCHVPLARAPGLADSVVATLPQPESHQQADFLANHGPTTARDARRCATCHARESCARCHPNVTDVARSAALEPDARVARAVSGLSPKYFTPPSHDRDDWLSAHGDSARARTPGCANCHAQPSCRSCHLGQGAASVIARLPRPDAGGAPGVRLRTVPVRLLERAVASLSRDAGRAAMAPGTPPTGVAAAGTPAPALDTLVRTVRVHPANFVERHGATAASGRLSCRGCHEERMCADCHDGAGRRRYHPLDFMSRHPASAAGRERDCASCHSTETFCRDCHRGEGLAARGTREVPFHDRQPLWLLQHGQAARQEMQSCAGCHRQSDCARCHSDLGLRVNPHGPGFDAERMAKRNKQMCLTCHLQDPLRRRE